MNRISTALFLALGLVAALTAAGCGNRAEADPAPDGMALIRGGEFTMGTNRGYAFEGPAHQVQLDSYYIDIRPVTNAEFARFVKATGYRTVAEKEGWSGVFAAGKKKWVAVRGADWRHPEGPASSIDGRDEYPVTQVCYFDAEEYARWAGKRLPTEAEFEYAARGGRDGSMYAWGEELNPGGKYLANYWQGSFPARDEGSDGFKGLSPAGHFPPNGYGLYDMTANIWHWVADWYSDTAYSSSAARNPRGPENGTERVIRGGSFLCCANFCAGYRVAARNKNTPDSATNHMGFRCVRDLRRR